MGLCISVCWVIWTGSGRALTPPLPRFRGLARGGATEMSPAPRRYERRRVLMREHYGISWMPFEKMGAFSAKDGRNDRAFAR